MGKLFGNLLSKLMVLLVAVIFFVELGNEIVTNDAFEEAFGALMGELPFAKIITDTLVQHMKVSEGVTIYSTSSVLQDLIILAVMATIQPLVMYLLSPIFLAMPDSFANWRDQEEYMDSVSYRVRETLLAILTAPVVAFFSAWLTMQFLDFLSQQVGEMSSLIIGVLALAAATTVSLIPLVLGGLVLGKALLWRLFVTLGRNMLEMLIVNVLCLALYVAVAGGSEFLFGSSIVAFLITMIILDFAFRCLTGAIVS